MDAKFYSSNSGTRLVEELYSAAGGQADGFQVVLNEYTRFHLVNERLKELQPQLDEQKTKVEKLRKELEKSKQKNQDSQSSAMQQKYKNERAALDEIARCVNILNGVKPPDFPDWLVSFIREVVGEKEGGGK